MRAVIQRVSHASVTIEGKVKSSIQQGFLILLGICDEDTMEDVDWLVNKIANLRVFGPIPLISSNSECKACLERLFR